jgi:Ca2+-binding EF-hand superfamily protein
VAPEEITELSDLFLRLDMHNDGTLTIDEIIQGFTGSESEKEIIRWSEGVDLDGSGDISYVEFIAATITENIYMNEGYLKQAF